MPRHFAQLALVVAIAMLAPFVAAQPTWLDGPLEGDRRIDVIHRVLADPMNPGVLIVAHRGHHRSHPENSIASIEAAIEAGAHVVEVDVAPLGDGSHVLMHDKTVNRTTDGTGKVADLTLEAVLEFRLTHNARPTNERIPTLEQAFEAADGRVMLNIDPKGLDIPGAAEVARNAGMLDHCIFKAWWNKIEDDFITWLDANPDVYFMPICRGEDEVSEAMALRHWPAIEVLVGSPDESLWTPEAVLRMKEAGIRPWMNTLWNGRISAGFGDEQAVEDPHAIFGPVLEMGWGYIQSDLPVRLAHSARRRGLDPTPHAPLTTDTFAMPATTRAPVEGFDRLLKTMRDPTDPSVIVIAHRGHTISTPENSLAAIDAAVEAGLHGVEIDVRRTADGVYVLMHDETLRRTTNGRGRVGETTLAEIKSLILMHGIYPTPHRVPTLLEAFEAARDRVIIDVDPKDVDIEEIAFLARQAGVLDQVVLKDQWASVTPESRSRFAASADVYFKPNVRTTEELRDAIAFASWPAIDAQRWTPDLIDQTELRGTRTWSGTIGRGRPGFLGDWHVSRLGPAAVYDPIVASSVGFVHSDLPELLIERVRAAGADPLMGATRPRVSVDVP